MSQSLQCARFELGNVNSALATNSFIRAFDWNCSALQTLRGLGVSQNWAILSFAFYLYDMRSEWENMYRRQTRRKKDQLKAKKLRSNAGNYEPRAVDYKQVLSRSFLCVSRCGVLYSTIHTSMALDVFLNCFFLNYSCEVQFETLTGGLFWLRSQLFGYIIFFRGGVRTSARLCTSIILWRSLYTYYYAGKVSVRFFILLHVPPWSASATPFHKSSDTLHLVELFSAR